MAEDLGWLDTNVFVHAVTRDAHSAACENLVAQLKSGDAQGRIDPVVVHELTYTLTRKFRFSRADAADYARMLLVLDSVDVLGGKEPVITALSIWDEQGVDFADALLSARAVLDGSYVTSVNVKDIQRTGARVRRPE
jgi:predicted nucleic acid-binding protein